MKFPLEKIMGIDVELHFHTTDGEPPNSCDSSIENLGELKNGSCVNGANFNVYSLSRYYGMGYERGSWPIISGALMSLFEAENVDKVWYFGDCHDDYGDKDEFTIDDLIEITKHYCNHGDRPYRGNKA